MEAGRTSVMTGTKPVLYTYPLAYFPARAALALTEKRVDYEPKYIDLFNGSSLSPAYIKLNPAGSAPTLVAGHHVIIQSREIVDYVNGLGDGPLGGSEVDQQLVKQWVDMMADWDGNLFMAGNGDPGTGKLLGKLQVYKIKYAEARAKEHPALAATYQDKIKGIKAAEAAGADPAAIAENKAQLVSILDDAEQQLAKTPYLGGNAYSAADVVLTPLIFRLGMAGKTGEYLKPRPNVSNYYDRMKARPSFQKVFGPAQSKLTAARCILPALVKAQLASITGWY